MNAKNDSDFATSVKVISINPSVKTLGELNLPSMNLECLSRSFSNPGIKSTAKSDLTGLFFGTSHKTGKWMQFKVLAIRIICAALLVYTGLIEGIPHNINNIESIIMLTAAGSMALGFMMRPLTVIAAAFLIFTGTWRSASDAIDMTTLFQTAACLVPCILGSGRISIDSIITRYIGRRKAMNRRRSRSREMDYRAYSTLERRLG